MCDCPQIPLISIVYLVLCDVTDVSCKLKVL